MQSPIHISLPISNCQLPIADLFKSQIGNRQSKVP
jgi:hypothetical protein